jgi:hypothetical protein
VLLEALAAEVLVEIFLVQQVRQEQIILEVAAEEQVVIITHLLVQAVQV